MSQNASDIREKVEQLSSDMAFLHRLVHGTDTETVPLGTPPVPTPSLRKMAKDIDARESAKADAVIAGATERINAEGATQEARVLIAGQAQTAAVNEAGETQHSRVNAEGNTQFSRVYTEGNTQYARVNEAGEAQTVQINAAGQTQYTAITTTANTLLADINTQGTVRKGEITSTGAAFLLQISANGDAQNSRLTATGAVENQKVRATGDAQRLIVILEGDTQIQRLVASGDAFNTTLQTLVREAAQSAKDAEESASKAVDMTHVGPAGKGKFGFVRIGNGIDVTEEGEISVAFPAVVSTPAVGFPAVVGIGYEYELSISAESAVYGANIATFIIAMDEDYVREVPAVNNAATHTLPIVGVSGTTGRIVVTAVDDLGNMSLDSVTTFQRNTVTIATPRVLSPVDAATDVSLAPLVTVQPMQVSGVPATFEHTQIQISTLDDFLVCVLDTGEDAPYTTQHRLAADLQKNTVYHVRVRHRAALYGWSEWSALSLFETMDCFVDVPVIYAPLNDITDVALRPTISVAAFTNTGPVDTPTATQIQIATDADFAKVVAQHDGGYVTTFAPAADLALITPYFVRARHKGARWDWSQWSQTTRFTTLNAYTQPAGLTYPANGAVNVPLLAILRVADFANVGPADTATGTHIQVARDADFADMVAEHNGGYTVAWTLPAMLTKLTGHFARARHKGARWGWGQWGAVATFTSEDAFVRTPTVTAPANGSTGVVLQSTISFSAFANAGPVDTAINTHFQVARDAAFANLIHDSGEIGGYVTSWTPGGNLALNAPHYVRVRHKGALWGWSAWSAVVGFTTLNAFVNAPTVTAPANNATGVALRPTVALSGFSNVGPADTGNGTQIQVALDAAFGNVVASYASAYTTSWTLGNNLALNTTYYVRARHSGAIWGWSAWGGTVVFTVLNAYVNPPVVIAPANGATGVSLTPLLQMSQATAMNQNITSYAFHLATKPDMSDQQMLGPYNMNTFIQIVTPLTINTIYYVVPFALGEITGWASGAVSSFRTVNGWVNAPTLTSPAANATVAGDSVYFTSSVFSVAHTTDTHVATEFAVNKVVNGVDIGFWNSGELTGANLLAFKANIPNFEEGMLYAAYVRHKGQNLGWSAWSVGVPVKLFTRSIIYPISKYISESNRVTWQALFSNGNTKNIDTTYPSIGSYIEKIGYIKSMGKWQIPSSPYHKSIIDRLNDAATPVYTLTSQSDDFLGLVVGDDAYFAQSGNGGFSLVRKKYKEQTSASYEISKVTGVSGAGVYYLNGVVFAFGQYGVGIYHNTITGETIPSIHYGYNDYWQDSVGYADPFRGCFVGCSSRSGHSSARRSFDGKNWVDIPTIPTPQHMDFSDSGKIVQIDAETDTISTSYDGINFTHMALPFSKSSIVTIKFFPGCDDLCIFKRGEENQVVAYVFRNGSITLLKDLGKFSYYVRFHNFGQYRYQVG